MDHLRTSNSFVEYVNASKPPKEDLKCPSAITKLTAHFTCGVMFHLAICKHRKEYGHVWHRMSVLRLGVVKQHKTQTQTYSVTA